MSDLIRFILDAGLVAKSVLIILLFLSIISWAIIFDKSRIFLKMKRESERFLRLFKLHLKAEDIYSKSKELHGSPFARIFINNYQLIKNPHPQIYGNENVSFSGQQQTAVKSERSSAVLDVAISEEITYLEKQMIFLATTVSVSPFLGLLGTVWGIMTAFIGMGAKGSADISAVGPGIAEALITTIAGLGVAIPAVIAYNYFVDKLRRLEKELNNFFSNLLLTAK